jgi:hypothetical protein
VLGHSFILANDEEAFFGCSYFIWLRVRIYFSPESKRKPHFRGALFLVPDSWHISNRYT